LSFLAWSWESKSPPPLGAPPSPLLIGGGGGGGGTPDGGGGGGPGGGGGAPPPIVGALAGTLGGGPIGGGGLTGGGGGAPVFIRGGGPGGDPTGGGGPVGGGGEFREGVSEGGALYAEGVLIGGGGTKLEGVGGVPNGGKSNAGGLNIGVGAGGEEVTGVTGVFNDGTSNVGVGEAVVKSFWFFPLGMFEGEVVPVTANVIPILSNTEKSMAVMVGVRDTVGVIGVKEPATDVGEEMSRDSTEDGWMGRFLRPITGRGLSTCILASSVLPVFVRVCLSLLASTVTSLVIMSNSLACWSKYLLISILALCT
jgi:hypothetical protein